MILDWIYPPRCIACRMIFVPFHNKRRPWLCENCRPLLTPVPKPVCPRCGHPATGICHACSGKNFFFKSHLAAFTYDETLRGILHEIKFRSQKQAAEGLGHILAETSKEWPIPKPDFIVPVPLHPKKKRSRGFNQAEVLARPLAKALGTPLATDMLHRIKNTLPQSGLSRTAREHNLKGAFSYNIKKYGNTPKTILLIDDIFTGGATMNACAKLLSESNDGTPDIYAMSLSLTVSDKLTNL